MLFPIRLVDYERIREREWMDGKLGIDLVEEVCKYFIPDFTRWKDHDAYSEAFERLLQDLRAEARK
ncbi:MAG: hypothetical protein GY953_11090 [bacterium]|nr:hypothetical protein [bacterium]